MATRTDILPTKNKPQGWKAFAPKDDVQVELHLDPSDLGDFEALPPLGSSGPRGASSADSAR